MNDDSSNLSGGEPAPAIIQQASAFMKRGIALLNENTPASLKESIGFFDEAIKLRRGFPLNANPRFRYGLAASWMNRGDALTRLGSGENLDEAVRSYDSALELLRVLPLDADPLYRRRLAIAWQNRGLALQAQGRAATVAEACRSFETAVDVLQSGNAASITDRDYLLAVAWMNDANALVSGKTHESAAKARIAAKWALALTASAETQDPLMAEAGLKTRHILCQAIAELFLEKSQPDLTRDELLAEATDAVDAALALARHWEKRGARQFRPLAQELFCFGARAYQIFQPHFLNEFLLENLDPAISPGAFLDDSKMHTAALESLWREFRKIQRAGFSVLDTEQMETFQEKLRELRVGEERLAQLRRLHLAARPGISGNPGTSENRQ